MNRISFSLIISLFIIIASCGPKCEEKSVQKFKILPQYDQWFPKDTVQNTISFKSDNGLSDILDIRFHEREELPEFKDGCKTVIGEYQYLDYNSTIYYPRKITICIKRTSYFNGLSFDFNDKYGDYKFDYYENLPKGSISPIEVILLDSFSIGNKILKDVMKITDISLKDQNNSKNLIILYFAKGYGIIQMEQGNGIKFFRQF